MCVRRNPQRNLKLRNKHDYVYSSLDDLWFLLWVGLRNGLHNPNNETQRVVGGGLFPILQ